MASEDPNEVFITDVAVTMIERSQNLQNYDVPNAKDFDDDASALTTQTVESLSVRDIFNNPTARLGDETALEAANKSTQNCVNLQNVLQQIAPLPSRAETPLLEELAVLPTRQNTKKILHASSNLFQ